MTDRPWWDPARHADRRPLLLTRNRIRRALTDWFEAEGFTEADPACLVAVPAAEVHLHALKVTTTAPDLTTGRAWLQTSPEFALKKLIAAGETRLFSFARVWRDREGGPRHATEFTMLEWYRADADYTQLMEDCATVLRIAAEAAGTTVFRHRDARCDPFAPLRRVTLAEAFAAEGIDLLATLPETDPAPLAAALTRAGIPHRPGDSWSDLFSKALIERIEPALGPAATILDRYPAPEAALARRTPDDPRTAERFELFACGVELANAFGELTDPAEQRARFTADMALRARLYGEAYPIDEDLLDALGHMPPTSGIALGFDRLVMLATGAPRLTDIMWSPPA